MRGEQPGPQCASDSFPTLIPPQHLLHINYVLYFRKEKIEKEAKERRGGRDGGMEGGRRKVIDVTDVCSATSPDRVFLTCCPLDTYN